jgi:hypothetical protein
LKLKALGALAQLVGETCRILEFSGLLMVIPGAENWALFDVLKRVRTFCSRTSKGKSSVTWPKSERICLLICFVALNNAVMCRI